jgi:hypothetical protein
VALLASPFGGSAGISIHINERSQAGQPMSMAAVWNWSWATCRPARFGRLFVPGRSAAGAHSALLQGSIGYCAAAGLRPTYSLRCGIRCDKVLDGNLLPSVTRFDHCGTQRPTITAGSANSVRFLCLSGGYDFYHRRGYRLRNRVGWCVNIFLLSFCLWLLLTTTTFPDK